MEFLAEKKSFHFLKRVLRAGNARNKWLKKALHVCHSKKSIRYSQQALRFNRICSVIGFSIIDVNILRIDLKIEVTMKKLLDNKFCKQGNLPGKIYLTKIPKLRRKTRLFSILRTIQPIQNFKIFYQKLTCY